MTDNRYSPFVTALRLGILAGGVAVLLSLMGMVEAFSERDIIAGVISLGTLLILAILVVFGYLTARAHPESGTPVLLAASILTGVIGELFLVGLVTLGLRFDLRAVLPNASPALYELIQFGRTEIQAYTFMLAFGAVAGAFGAGPFAVPRRYSRPLTVGIMAAIVIGLLEDLIQITLAATPGLIPAMRWMLASGVENGLTILGAVVVFVGSSALAFFWPSIRSTARARSQALPASRRRTLVVAAYLLFILILLLLPIPLGPYLTEVSNTVIIFTVMALGLNIVVGFAGLLDLGYVAFFAIGAFTMGVLTTTAIGDQAGQIVWGPGLSFWAALPFAVLLTILAGVLLGVPVLRMRGDYLAIVTLGFGEIVRILALSDALKPFVGGSQGIVQVAVPSVGQLTASLSSQRLYYYLVLICVALVIFIATRLRDSRQGRSWMAMREDEDVAQAMGVRLVPTKLLAFASGAAMAGLAGAIFASKVGSVYPHSFNLLVSINVLAVVIVGGMGSNRGVIAGALVLFGLPELLREFSEYRYFVFGAMLIAMMLLKPEGLIPDVAHRRELHAAEGPQPPPEAVQVAAGD